MFNYFTSSISFLALLTKFDNKFRCKSIVDGLFLKTRYKMFILIQFASIKIRKSKNKIKKKNNEIGFLKFFYKNIKVFMTYKTLKSFGTV